MNLTSELLMSWISQQTIKDVRRLLGMVIFLSKFIPKVSKVIAPLKELLKYDMNFQWSFEQNKAFKLFLNY